MWLRYSKSIISLFYNRNIVEKAIITTDSEMRSIPFLVGAANGDDELGFFEIELRSVMTLDQYSAQIRETKNDLHRLIGLEEQHLAGFPAHHHVTRSSCCNRLDINPFFKRGSHWNVVALSYSNTLKPPIPVPATI